MNTHISKLTLNAHQAVCELTFSLSSEHRDLGKIFILALIQKAPDPKRLSKQIITETKSQYLNSVAKDPEKALEDTLQKINYFISQLIKSTQKDWLSASHIAIAVIKDNEVHFTALGKIHGYLASHNDISSIADDAGETEPNPVKAFASIYSGSIPDDNCMLLVTDSVLDYVSQDKLKKLSLLKGPDESLEKILKKAPHNKSFGCVFIQRREEKPADDEDEEPVPTYSLSEIEEEEEENVLTKKQEKHTDQNDSVEEKEEEEPDEENGEKEVGIEKNEDQTIEGGMEKIHLTEYQQTQKTTTVGLDDLRESDDATSTKILLTEEKTTKIHSPLPMENQTHSPSIHHSRDDDETYEREYHQKRAPTSRLDKPPTKKLASKVFMVLIIAAGIAGAVWGVKSFLLSKNDSESPKNEDVDQIQQQAQAQFDLLVTSIQSKFIDAQNFIMNEKMSEAKLLLDEITALVTQLPEDSEDRRQQKQGFANKVQTQLLLTQGVQLTAPTLIASLSNFKPQEIILRDGALYTYNPQDTSVFKRDLSKTDGFISLPITAEGIGPLAKLLDHTGATLLFYHSLDGLAELNLENNTIKSLEWIRSFTGSVHAANVYQNKLYVISQDNRLLRYAQSITGFTQETEWLKSPSPSLLENSVDMAIDSAIWVLKSNGEILKFFKGESQAFTTTIHPPIKKPIALFTDLDLLNLYVLDAGTNRVVIIKKEDGSITSQLTAQEFSEVSDFAVDEAKKKIYIVDGMNVFEILF